VALETKKLAVSVPPFGPEKVNVRVAGVFADTGPPPTPKATQEIFGGQGRLPGLPLRVSPPKENANVTGPLSNVHPAGMLE